MTPSLPARQMSMLIDPAPAFAALRAS